MEHTTPGQEAQTQEQTGIELAIGQAGTQDKLADALGVTQQAVSGWLRQGWTPLERAIEIEAQFGVRREFLVHPRLRSAFANVEL